jgi:hypothetical protein
MYYTDIFKSQHSARQPFLLLTLLCILAVPIQAFVTNLMGKPGEGYYIKAEIGSPPQTVG